MLNGARAEAVDERKALLENPSKDAKLSVYEPWPTACWEEAIGPLLSHHHRTDQRRADGHHGELGSGRLY